jgi:cytochrome P450
MPGGVVTAITCFVKELLNIPDGETQKEIDGQEARSESRKAQQREAERRARQARKQARKVAPTVRAEQVDGGVNIDEMLDTILGKEGDSNGDGE